MILSILLRFKCSNGRRNSGIGYLVIMSLYRNKIRPLANKI